ncbi:MAG: hypothetical protein Q4E55_04905 [Bacteroidales bacterium]|nr:hypothetical protein [Bacteroidales bacterium]
MAVWTIALLGCMSVSCSDNDTPKASEEPKVTLPKRRMFILNEGSFETNNAGITFYAPSNDANIIGDIYKAQNTAALGQYGQWMVAHRGYIYIAVNGSNYLSMLDNDCVEQRQLSFGSYPELQGGVRDVVAYNDCLYADFYGGMVVKINAKTLEIERMQSGVGNNLEKMTVANGKLYVTNAYKIDDKGTYVYLDEVVVLDANTLEKLNTIKVDMNPNFVLTAGGKVVLVSYGDYYTVGYSLQLIDPQNDTATRLDVQANKCCMWGDKLFFSLSTYNYESNNYTTTFGMYDLQTGSVSKDNILLNAPATLCRESVCMMDVDADTGDLYIGTTDYFSNGDVYRFDSDGRFKEQFETGSVNPKVAVFIDK